MRNAVVLHTASLKLTIAFRGSDRSGERSARPRRALWVVAHLSGLDHTGSPPRPPTSPPPVPSPTASPITTHCSVLYHGIGEFAIALAL